MQVCFSKTFLHQKKSQTLSWKQSKKKGKRRQNRLSKKNNVGISSQHIENHNDKKIVMTTKQLEDFVVRIRTFFFWCKNVFEKHTFILCILVSLLIYAI